MTSTNELSFLAHAAIKSIDPNSSFIDDKTLTILNAIFPEKLIIAALDLIDRRNIICYQTSWGYTEYEVLGSSENGLNRPVGDSVSSYSVLLDVHMQPLSIPYSCSCPAFLHSVLKSGTHIMCKHILASLIARQMNLCITRPTNLDELAALYMRQFPPSFVQPLSE